ncbi:unnamed protein product [Clavelina lepadiformis]|uniref:5'-(N(7)-methylguanosine 5'-triphospho)-[mRNA] hydrolase n=1 Tax=Clavelina lepadiformis TaxID=159417 RepID=A0ABP0EV01_CLALP
MEFEGQMRTNLEALQRQDPCISKIVDFASPVAVYTFCSQSRKWEKTEMEGTLYVYTRGIFPKFGFTIMNQGSREYLAEVLTPDLEFRNHRDEFLIYRNSKSPVMIYGLWFYVVHDFKRIGTLLMSHCKKEEPFSPPNMKLSANDESILWSPNTTFDSGTSSVYETAFDEVFSQLAPKEKSHHLHDNNIQKLAKEKDGSANEIGKPVLANLDI